MLGATPDEIKKAELSDMLHKFFDSVGISASEKPKVTAAVEKLCSVLIDNRNECKRLSMINQNNEKLIESCRAYENSRCKLTDEYLKIKDALSAPYEDNGIQHAMMFTLLEAVAVQLTDKPILTILKEADDINNNSRGKNEKTAGAGSGSADNRGGKR